MPGLSSDLFVHGRSRVLAHVLGDRHDLHRQRSCAETDGDHIAHLHVVGCPLYPAVDGDTLGVAGLIGHGAALDEPRDLQIFVQTHGVPPIRKAGVSPHQPLHTSAYFATASFRALPALKAGILVAAICTGVLVRGLRPVRAARFLVSKEPKPTSWIFSSAFRVSVMVFRTALTAASESFLDRPVFSATAAISSVLFMLFPPKNFRW